MKSALLVCIILLTVPAYEQEITVIKGIAVERTGTPIPYCSVSVKGTKIAATTNNCGEFELAAGKEEFTIVFSCLHTHDFITIEKRVNPQEVPHGNTIVFRLEKHGKILNKECKKELDKRRFSTFKIK